jgi:hypothetical protein
MGKEHKRRDYKSCWIPDNPANKIRVVFRPNTSPSLPRQEVAGLLREYTLNLPARGLSRRLNIDGIANAPVERESLESSPFQVCDRFP